MMVEIAIYVLTFVSFLTWLVFVLTAAKIYKFFVEFEKFKSKNDVELNHAVWSLNKIQENLPEVVAHLQRINSLLFDIYKGRMPLENQTPGTDTKPEYTTEDILRHEHKIRPESKTAAEKAED